MTTRRRGKLVAYYLIGAVLLGLGIVGFCSLAESRLLKEAPYDVDISEAPGLRGRIYSLEEDRYLLVVFIPRTAARRGFIVDVERKEIGIPNFRTYTRLGRFALVDKMTLLGYPKPYAELVADFENADGVYSIKVTAHAFDPNFTDPDTKACLEAELIYNRRVVLKPRSEKGRQGRINRANSPGKCKTGIEETSGQIEVTSPITDHRFNAGLGVPITLCGGATNRQEVFRRRRSEGVSGACGRRLHRTEPGLESQRTESRPSQRGFDPAQMKLGSCQTELRSGHFKLDPGQTKLDPDDIELHLGIIELDPGRIELDTARILLGRRGCPWPVGRPSKGGQKQTSGGETAVDKPLSASG